MNAWQTVLFLVGLFNLLLGAGLLAAWWRERRQDRRAERMFDRVFCERAGIQPTFLGRRK